MSEQKEGFSWLTATKADEVIDLVARLFEVAKPSAVFGTPMEVGDRTVFTASESSVSMGAGFGFGGGSGTEKTETGEPGPESTGEGGGGGGGGFSMSRPVAVVSVGADGVRVEPVFDITKIALAFFMMLGSTLMMRARMRRAMRFWKMAKQRESA